MSECNLKRKVLGSKRKKVILVHKSCMKARLSPKSANIRARKCVDIQGAEGQVWDKGPHVTREEAENRGWGKSWGASCGQAQLEAQSANASPRPGRERRPPAPLQASRGVQVALRGRDPRPCQAPAQKQPWHPSFVPTPRCVVSAVLLCLLTGGKRKRTRGETGASGRGRVRVGDGKVPSENLGGARWGLGGGRLKLGLIPNSREKMTGCHAN